MALVDQEAVWTSVWSLGLAPVKISGGTPSLEELRRTPLRPAAAAEQLQQQSSSVAAPCSSGRLHMDRISLRIRIERLLTRLKFV